MGPQHTHPNTPQSLPLSLPADWGLHQQGLGGHPGIAPHHAELLERLLQRGGGGAQRFGEEIVCLPMFFLEWGECFCFFFLWEKTALKEGSCCRGAGILRFYVCMLYDVCFFLCSVEHLWPFRIRSSLGGKWLVSFLFPRAFLSKSRVCEVVFGMFSREHRDQWTCSILQLRGTWPIQKLAWRTTSARSSHLMAGN